MRKQLLNAYLDSRCVPVQELVGAQSLHNAIRNECPKLYAGILGDKTAHISHRAAVFASLARNQSTTARDMAQEISDSLASSDSLDVLRILDVIPQYKINGRRAAQTTLRVLLGREDFAEMVAHRRQRVLRLLKHLLGERTWSSVERALEHLATFTNPADQVQHQRFVDRKLLRFAQNREAVTEALRFVAGLGFPTSAKQAEKPKAWLAIPWLSSATDVDAARFQPQHEALRKSLAARSDISSGKGLPAQTLSGLRGTYSPETPVKRIRALAAATTSPDRDNPLTAEFKRAMSAEDVESRQVEGLVEDDNPVLANVAIVLDMSASMASSGERLNHPAALGQAIVQQLQASVAHVSVATTGGSDENGFASPSGSADLAAAVLGAVATDPEIIFVITDGFENSRQGDVSIAVNGLRALNITTPVHQVLPLFKATEEISQRLLGDNIPVIAIDSERETSELLARSQLAGFPEVIGEQDVDAFCQLAL